MHFAQIDLGPTPFSRMIRSHWLAIIKVHWTIFQRPWIAQWA